MQKEMQNNQNSESQSYSCKQKQQLIQSSVEAKIQEGIQRKRILKQKAVEMGISLSQLKNLQKRDKWQQLKLVKRKQKRQKQRQKKKETKKKNQQNQLLNSQQKINLNTLQNQKLQNKQQQKHTLKRRDQYRQNMKDNIKVVIDLQFYDLMTQKQLNSLIKQLSYCHAINRKMQKPFNFILTSVTQERSNFIDSKYNGKKWGINMVEQVVHNAFKAQDLVYLTGDAEEQIQEYDQSKIYIIGGIVDHNRLKKITYNYAKQNKIVVKRLPLKQIKLKTNVHLAVNHVWQWMLRKYNGETWDKSLEKVLPQRKIEKI